MTADHVHTFSPFHYSPFGGSFHRDCLELGCRFISLDADDDQDDESEER